MFVPGKLQRTKISGGSEGDNKDQNVNPPSEVPQDEVGGEETINGGLDGENKAQKVNSLSKLSGRKKRGKKRKYEDSDENAKVQEGQEVIVPAKVSSHKRSTKLRKKKKTRHSKAFIKSRSVLQLSLTCESLSQL